jgi:hypothetical protein
VKEFLGDGLQDPLGTDEENIQEGDFEDDDFEDDDIDDDLSSLGSCSVSSSTSLSGGSTGGQQQQQQKHSSSSLHGRGSSSRGGRAAVRGRQWEARDPEGTLDLEASFGRGDGGGGEWGSAAAVAREGQLEEPSGS